MPEMIIRDVRVEGPRPKGNLVLEVAGNTPLSWPLLWVASEAGNEGNSLLKIIAHGLGIYVASLAGNYGARVPVVSQGGSGLKFCREGITLATLPQFSAWRGKLRQIEILGCGAAYITPGYEGKEGDGNLLCSRLAQITQANVRASTATQMYNLATMDMGSWEGTVLTYGPLGDVIRVEQAPEN
jgi:hypothetical protein